MTRGNDVSLARFGTVPRLVGVFAIFAAACGQAAPPESVETTADKLAGPLRVRIQAILPTIAKDPPSATDVKDWATAATNFANTTFADAGIVFELEPTVIVEPSLSCLPIPAGPDGLRAYGNDVVLGKVAAFYCGGDLSGSGDAINNAIWWFGSGDVLAHELGHYFGLNHDFRKSWVADDDHKTVSSQRSVETCIRARLLGTSPLPPDCAGMPPRPSPPVGQNARLLEAVSVRNLLLNGDGIADTGITLEEALPGDRCAPMLSVPLRVSGVGSLPALDFAPARNNVMGYYRCPTLDPMGQGKIRFSPSQIAIMREKLLSGNRTSLIPRPLVSWNSASFNDPVWTAEQHYSTIAFPNINGSGGTGGTSGTGGRSGTGGSGTGGAAGANGGVDVCGRAPGGITCATSTGTAFVNTRIWNASYADPSWSSVQYYSTIAFPNVGGSSASDVCGRGAGGVICATSNGTDAFTNDHVWNSNFSDVHGWNVEKYYGTIQFPDVSGGGTADMCGRGAGGILCGISDGSTSFAGPTLWDSTFNDTVWASPEYYRTIRFPDVDGGGRADVCGRGPNGIVCGKSNGTSAFTGTTSWDSSFFSDAAQWNVEKHYRTIAFPDLNGDGKADVCGRGVGGVFCGISDGNQFTSIHLWTTEFSDGGCDQAKCYRTLTFADLDGDGDADICGRKADGMYCAYSNAGPTENTPAASGAFVNLRLYSADVTDAAGWDQPQYYRTLRVAKVGLPGAPAKLCGRGVFGILCER